jgi:hypothetical protein
MKDARLLDVLAFRTGRRCLFWDVMLQLIHLLIRFFFHAVYLFYLTFNSCKFSIQSQNTVQRLILIKLKFRS